MTVLCVVEPLVPLIRRLDVDGSNLLALAQKIRDQVAADESSATGDDDDLAHASPLGQ